MAPPDRAPVAVPLHGITVVDGRISASARVKSRFMYMAPHLYNARCKSVKLVTNPQIDIVDDDEESGSGEGASGSPRPRPQIKKVKDEDNEGPSFKV